MRRRKRSRSVPMHVLAGMPTREVVRHALDDHGIRPDTRIPPDGIGLSTGSWLPTMTACLSIG